MTNDKWIDAVREIINIGIGDTAAALSDLINERVIIRVPDVHILGTNEVPDFINKEIKSLGVYIAQGFHGTIKGKAILFYTKESSISLIKNLTGDSLNLDILSERGMSILQEIGNILLVSCISTISNIIEDRITFEIPHVTVAISEGYFANLIKGLDEMDKTIIVKNEMTIKDKNISGYIFIILGFRNFKTIIDKIQKKMAQ